MVEENWEKASQIIAEKTRRHEIMWRPVELKRPDVQILGGAFQAFVMGRTIVVYEFRFHDPEMQETGQSVAIGVAHWLEERAGPERWRCIFPCGAPMFSFNSFE